MDTRCSSPLPLSTFPLVRGVCIVCVRRYIFGPQPFRFFGLFAQFMRNSRKSMREGERERGGRWGKEHPATCCPFCPLASQKTLYLFRISKPKSGRACLCVCVAVGVCAHISHSGHNQNYVHVSICLYSHIYAYVRTHTRTHSQLHLQ